MNATKESPHGTNRKTATGVGGLSTPKSIKKGDKRMNSTKESPHGTNRKTAIIVGVLYILGTVAGVLSIIVLGGLLDAPDYLNIVASSASRVQLMALLMLVMGLPLAMVPVVMFPILKKQNEALAIGYVVFRGALETFTYIALALSWLLLVVVARQYAESGAAVASQFSNLGILLVKAIDPINAIRGPVFSLGALMFYYLLYQARLIPRWLSGWGIVAAVACAAAGLTAIFGTTLDILSMPMFLQEMVMAVWLIVKGFNPSLLADKAAIAGIKRSVTAQSPVEFPAN